MTEDRELALRDDERLLLEGVDDAIDDEEPDEMARRADRQRPKVVALARPRFEGLLPRQVQQRRRGLAKAKPGKGCRAAVGQMRFRR